MARLRILQTECSPNWGGQELRILVESLELVRRGHRVWVGAPPGSALIRRAAAAGLPTLGLPMRGSLNPRATLRLWRLVRSEGIELIHCHGSRDNWSCYPLRALGVPIIRWRHISAPVPPRLARSFIYRHGSRRLIATSADIAAALTGRNGVRPAKVEVLLEGIDRAEFHPGVSGGEVRRQFGIGDSAPLFGIIAMLRPDKGHSHFIAAAARVVAERPEARFLVVGEETEPGSLLPRLQAQVAGLGLEGKVIFAGYREDVAAVTAALDVLVVASTGVEGVSRVIPQAFMMRRPVVATTVGGLPELVRNEVTGLLVPPAEPEAAARAMLRLANERALAGRLAAAGHELASSELSLAAIIDRLEAIQDEVVSARRPQASHQGRGAL